MALFYIGNLIDVVTWHISTDSRDECNRQFTYEEPILSVTKDSHIKNQFYDKVAPLKRV